MRLSGTNIALFNPDISDSQILSVIEDLGLSEWYASLSDGLDTMIAAGGLSAGEGQFAGICAGIFSKIRGSLSLTNLRPRLDPATEQQIDRAIQKLLHKPDGYLSSLIALALLNESTKL